MRKDKKSFCRWGFYVIGKIITKRYTITNNNYNKQWNQRYDKNNTGITLKWTTRKVANQEEGILNFLRSIRRDNLPLRKNVFTS